MAVYPVRPWNLDSLQARVALFHTMTYSWDVLDEPLKSLRKAAVLIPLVIDASDGSLHVWLTKRSEVVSNDKVLIDDYFVCNNNYKY